MNLSNKEVREKLYEIVGHGITSVSETRLTIAVTYRLCILSIKYGEIKTHQLSTALPEVQILYFYKKTFIMTNTFILQLPFVKIKSSYNSYTIIIGDVMLNYRNSTIYQENLMKLVSKWQKSY